MASQTIESADDILAQVRTPGPVAVDCSALRKGIDNYHIDLQLGSRFVLLARQVIDDMAKRVIAGRRASANVSDTEELREAYVDIVKDSLHRTKTDFTPEQVRVLHFGIIKFILTQVRTCFDDRLKEIEETLSQQQYSGSRSLPLVNILYNPMLAGSSVRDPLLLVENYALWPEAGKGLAAANLRAEETLSKRLESLEMTPLRPAERAEGQSEVYDELGGLFAVQELLGPAGDQKDRVGETFCWFEHPGNVRLLFDADQHAGIADDVDGMRAQWKFKSESKRLVKAGSDAARAFADDDALKVMMAGYLLREEWNPAWDDALDLPGACQYVAGFDQKKILARIDQGKDGVALLIKKLDELAKEVGRAWKDDVEDYRLRVLTDLARFRLHLKYFRFAHRIFNRISVITDPQQIQLSKANGHLNRLLGTTGDEAQELGEPQIIHHAVLKADVRGSTTVTQELIRQNLNPASYFSTRFFGPINQLLPVYGAEKIFIEGDALILGIYEYDQSPEEWYSVSRICGIAKEILDIVSSKNSHSRSTGLPMLELGIGICFEHERPLFLFDDDRPIMISPAIGDADRMSSCSWNLRDVFRDSSFNVEVLDMVEGDASKGEKGQSQARYNLNGILLSDGAFSKLKSEIQLKRVKTRVGDVPTTLYVGRFPDVRGKERDLVIREGHVGTWDGERAAPGDDSSARFYEVLPNSKLASQVVAAASK